MSDHRITELEHRLRRLEERVAEVADGLDSLIVELNGDLVEDEEDDTDSPPAAPTLSGTFTLVGDSMNAILVATLPGTRQDNTALPPTAIASITYQKTSLTGSPPAPGPLQSLQTNKASGTPAQLQPADLTFTDAAAAPGDDYTCFVTDTLGHIGKASNDQVAPASASPPGAPTLTATFA
jgi:hypothetical protein